MASDTSRRPIYKVTLKIPPGSDRMILLAQTNAGMKVGSLWRPTSQASTVRRCRRCRQFVVRDLKAQTKAMVQKTVLRNHPRISHAELVERCVMEFERVMPMALHRLDGEIEKVAHPECDRCGGSGWEADDAGEFDVWTGIVMASGDATGFWNFGDTLPVPRDPLPATEWVQDIHAAFCLPDASRPVMLAVEGENTVFMWAPGMALVTTSLRLPVWVKTGNYFEGGCVSLSEPQVLSR